jgi:transcriptional regulator with XRE-family HTH domain
MPQPSAVALRIKMIRDWAVVPASHLSIAAGVSQSLIRQIEAGEIQDPGVKVLAGIAEQLDIDFQWLATGNGEEPVKERVRDAGERFRAMWPAQKRTGTDPA